MSTPSLRPLVTACSALILLVYLAGFVRYASVWENDLTLWLHAVPIAPQKPRPHLWLVLALVERHRYVEAQLVLDEADRIVRDVSTVPAWDRADASAAITQDRLLVSRAAGTGPHWGDR